MDIQKLMGLYQKERMYQKCCFGDYHDIKSLNFATFLLFIEQYLKRAKKEYAGKWSSQLPPWLESTKEIQEGGSAPIQAYEELIKVFVLAGAALETYADIDPDHWREHFQDDMKKWQK